MRLSTGRARRGTATGRVRPAASTPADRPAVPAVPEGPPARTTDELVAAVRALFDAPPREAAAVVGLTGARVDGVERTDLCAGEGPVLAAIQSVLLHSDAAALVVFTDCPPPQWVDQPCFLLREVAVVATDAREHRTGGLA